MRESLWAVVVILAVCAPLVTFWIIWLLSERRMDRWERRR
jgi:hypothetical protein